MKKLGARILVVDEERDILCLLQRTFTAHEYQVFNTTNTADTMEALAQHRPDLLLLGLDGFGRCDLELCQQVRSRSSLPIIVLSGNERECDKVRALDLGADDYVCKPFGIQELLARVRVAFRHVARLSSGTRPLVHVGPLTIDLARRLVHVRGQEVQLTPTEYDLLKAFNTNRDKILSRQLLLSQVWGIGYESDILCLHVYIAQLRRKIEVDSGRPHLIVNVPGVGYRFTCEDEHSG